MQSPDYISHSECTSRLEPQTKFGLPTISITPLGSFETSIFDMYCGGTGCILYISVAARDEAITMCDFLLTLPAGFPQINWLADPADQVPPRGFYRLPNGLEFPRKSVLNHRVLGAGLLHRGACLEGLLLGWASGRVPKHLRHGLFLNANLTILDHLDREHTRRLALWLNRSELNLSPSPQLRGEGLFGGSSAGNVRPGTGDEERLCIRTEDNKAVSELSKPIQADGKTSE